MKIASICYLISKFRSQSLRPLGSKNARCLSENFHLLRHSPGLNAELKLPGPRDFGSIGRSIHRTSILQPITRRISEQTRGFRTSRPSSKKNGFFDGIVTGSTPRSSLFSCLRNNECCDAEREMAEGEVPKHPVRVFVFDFETTGFCRKGDGIIEIAIRDLSGGENSCFHTLINPEQPIRNSHVHGITTEMVNDPGVPRMKELIPILLQYIRSRLKPGEIPLFVAHNCRRFDLPFLIEEFRRCSMAIPHDWRFLDSCPLGRELMKKMIKSNGSKVPSKISLLALAEYYEIRSEGPNHRAMTDVNLLTSVLEKMVFDMKLTLTDLLERSFGASDLANLGKIKK